MEMHPTGRGDGTPQLPTCAFTVDVEDWYQSTIDFDAPITDRVVKNVDRICAMLDEHQITGTFFVQGLVAEAFPRMLRDLIAQGHEIQSHGYSHPRSARGDWIRSRLFDIPNQDAPVRRA
jgi:peptidoglycan/xylan/chitin deacetylase (PgdA/CDA1 family)